MCCKLEHVLNKVAKLQYLIEDHAKVEKLSGVLVFFSFITFKVACYVYIRIVCKRACLYETLDLEQSTSKCDSY